MEEIVYFKNLEGETLAGTLHLPAQPAPEGVIFGHCFTCSRHTSILRDTATKLAERGIASLRFDFSGNGQSGGDFINTAYTRHIREMTQAQRFLSDRGISRFGLAGHSMGAAVSILAGSRMETVDGICAFSGRLGGLDPEGGFTSEQISELRETGRVAFQSRGRRLELPGAFFEDAARYDILQTIASLAPPLLIVHGDRDEIIPVWNARAAKARNDRATLEIIAGADHMYGDAALRDKVAALAADWFRKCFDGPR
ncbi:alpha/beta hydrolase [Desulfococcus sp.]|uniref:alpha/beta hydrolase n=1 Tax=Desulfococcus sp. TaxID=2025834 RepID=UPI00359339C4